MVAIAAQRIAIFDGYCVPQASCKPAPLGKAIGLAFRGQSSEYGDCAVKPFMPLFSIDYDNHFLIALD
jgi:hypothetical protein